jgi:hypothetical protein
MKTLRVAALAVSALVAVPAVAADTISATHVFPASLIYSRRSDRHDGAASRGA